MIELDLSDQIATLRTTFADIRAVVGVDKLEAEIADLSEQAGAPDLWDDPDNAQKVTSALSHRQAELARITSIERRLDDLEVLVAARQRGRRRRDERRARPRPSSPTCRRHLGDLEVQTLLDGEYDARPAVITIRAGAGGVDAADFAEMLHAHVPALGREAQVPGDRHGHLLRRGGRHQVGDLRGRRALRVRHAQRRGRHAPPRADDARSAPRASARRRSPRSR